MDGFSRAMLLQRCARRGIERVPRATFHARQLESREQDREVRRVHLDVLGAGRAPRSLETSSLQSLHPNHEPIAIPMKKLDPVEPAIEEQEEITQADVAL